MTNNDDLAAKIRMMANHGQSRQYYHDTIGVNSRLDSIQAGILDVKLRHLDEYSAARQAAAAYYDTAFSKIDGLVIPARQHNSSHVFHQYTLRVKHGQRNALRTHLTEGGVSAMIYYPIPLYKQKAYSHYWSGGELAVTEELCDEVMSLPIHTELNEEILAYIVETVTSFFER